MSSLKELVSITEELNGLLDQITKDNRLEIIEKINATLNQRESLIKQLELSNMKKDPVLNKLLSDENKIKSKMQQIFSDIKNDIRLINKKRMTGESYINPYQSIYVDGVFFDKKK